MNDSKGALYQVNAWLIRIFATFWMAYLCVDYLQASDFIANGLKFHEYMDTMVLLLLLTLGGAAAFVKNWRKLTPLQFKGVNGLTLFGGFALFMGVIFAAYTSKTSGTTSYSFTQDSAVSASVNFLIRILARIAFLVFVLASAWSWGQLIGSQLPLRLHRDSRILVYISIGFSVMGMGLFLLGAVNALIAPVIAVWLILPIGLCFKQITPLFKRVFWTRSKAFEMHPAGIGLVYILLIFTAMNFLNSNRPIPIGFDALSLYMNIPKQIASYNGLMAGGQAYNWSLIMSMGFILFKNTPIALFLSILPGLLSVFVVYRIARNFSSIEWSLFAAAAFYTVPVVMWQSKSDAKVDLGLLFIMSSVVLLIIEHCYGEYKQLKTARSFREPDIVFWALVGWLCGYSFGIKYTALMLSLALVVFILYRYSGKWAALAGFFLNFSIIFGLRLYEFSDLYIGEGIELLILGPAFASVPFVVLAILKEREGLARAATIVSVMGAITILSFMPWMVKHVSENGNLSLESVVSGKSALPTLSFVPVAANGQIQPIQRPDEPRVLKAQAGEEADKRNDGFVAKNSQKKFNTGKYEEISRYLGYESGFMRFLTVFYDAAMKNNVKLVAADIGILLFMLFPLCLLSLRGRELPLNLLKMAGLVFLLSFCILSDEMKDHELKRILKGTTVTEDRFGDNEALYGYFGDFYSTGKQALIQIAASAYPLYEQLGEQNNAWSLFNAIFSAVLLFAAFYLLVRPMSAGRKAFLLFCMAYFFIWFVLSSGIFWYGILGLALLPVAIAIFFGNSKFSLGTDKISTYLIGIFVGCWFFLIGSFRMVPAKISFVTIDQIKNTPHFSTELQEAAFGKYAIGDLTQDEAVRFIGKEKYDMLKALNRDRSAKIMRVGTFLNYHIERNDSRVYMDNQLDMFNSVYNASSLDPVETARRMRNAGLKYILVDLTTPSIDVTPEKSLTKKFNDLMRFTINNPQVMLVNTDRIVQRPDGNKEMMIQGQKVRVMNHVAGTAVVQSGTTALFMLK